MHCKSLWIKASAKCINVNVNYVGHQNAENNISLGVVKEMFHKIRNRLCLNKTNSGYKNAL